jgi:regulatory protein
MSTITALKTGKRDQKKVNLFLDGSFAFSVEKEAALNEGLQVGVELTGPRLDALMRTLQKSRCLDAAYRFLAYRPRSEAELKERLARRGFLPGDIEAALVRLREQGFTNDSEFARFWTENRSTFSPRSRSLTRSELHKKGVADDIIREAVSEIDEAETAYRAAQTKMRRFAALDFPEFRHRLGNFLRRRGFGYETISRTVKRVWQEKENKIL